MQRSLQWGAQSVAGYGAGNKEASRVYARPGIDTNPKYQTLGRLGEVAFCIYVNHDPGELDWGPFLDRGCDLVLNDAKIDVKTSKTSCLIWPVTKNHFLSPPKADIFVAACGARWFHENDETIDLLGYVTSDKFIREHKIAPPPAHFDPGTKYMEADALWPIKDLTYPFRFRQACDQRGPLSPVNFRGFVGYDDGGRFVHYCHCGQWGAFGFGYFPRKDKLGTWYCAEHKAAAQARGDM